MLATRNYCGPLMKIVCLIGNCSPTDKGGAVGEQEVLQQSRIHPPFTVNRWYTSRLPLVV